MNLLVYCGSSPGHHECYATAAEHVGASLAARQWGLVYGGGGVGLMGILARTALAHGAHVAGIIPAFLCTDEVAFYDVSEHIIVQSMHERKLMMMERADMIMAMSGGFGTMEELFEAITWMQLGLHQKPIGVLNTDGFYNHLQAQLDHMVQHGFLSPRNRALIHFDDDAERLLDHLSRNAMPGVSETLESRS